MPHQNLILKEESLSARMWHGTKTQKLSFDIEPHPKIQRLDFRSGASATESRATLATDTPSSGINDPAREQVVRPKGKEAAVKNSS